MKKIFEEIIPNQKKDRRMLSNVPDSENVRQTADRRGKDIVEGTRNDNIEYIESLRQAGLRYITKHKVKMKLQSKQKNRYKKTITAISKDTSSSGVLLELKQPEYIPSVGEKYLLNFEITPGSMPEGFENRIKVTANVVRIEKNDEDNTVLAALEFDKNLNEYLKRRKWNYSVYTASMLLFFIVLTVILMRTESILFFKYNKLLYFYSIITAIFLLTRYLFGALYRPVKINADFTPGVSIIIPCFNEEKWITRTILSCINQDYPLDKLEVIVVDDCSNDNSVEVINNILDKLYNETERFKTKERLSLIVQPYNQGKRHALAAGAEKAKHELVVFVDSDSFLEPTAIKNLVQPFQNPKIGGVTGRTDVENKYTNALTKMQAVRYYVAFRIMKAAEAYFDCVTCLSGPLSCYRKELVLKNKDKWLNQKFFGNPATFGDDRSMTNLILKTHQTGYQDTAVCSTVVPSSHKVFLKQQMRWKRSWLRESLIAATNVWKKEPFMSVFFYMGLLIPIIAPLIVVYNLIYVPIAHRVFPLTFLMGLLLMSLLMSFADLFFRRSSLWIFGLVFCIYYEAILLWQMPIAFVTFWKSTWGTRLTPQDIAEMNKRKGITSNDNVAIKIPKSNNTKSQVFNYKKKEKRKKRRTVFQIIILLVLSWVIINAIFDIKRYDSSDIPAATSDNGFIAVSYFGVDRTEKPTLIDDDRLKSHLKALKASGYVTISQQDILDYITKGKLLPPKSLYLMFEDGRADSSLYAQKIMEALNYKATMFTYANKFAEKDNKFLMPKDLIKMEKSTFWELGSNGYRFEYINVFNRYGEFFGMLNQDQFNYIAKFVKDDYNHYLMDFIKDKDRIPVENREQMDERITWDYDQMNDIYTSQIGKVPDVYMIMHSGGLYGDANPLITDVNEREIKKLFKLHFNGEGESLNNAVGNRYNLTRMQAQPYWYTNHLLMRIYDDTKMKPEFKTGDEKRSSYWDVNDGAAEFDGGKIILTSNPSAYGTMQLKQTKGFGNFVLTANLNGNALGEQSILLRNDTAKNSFVKVSLSDKNLIIQQKQNGKAENLFKCELPEKKIQSEDEVKLESDKANAELTLKYSQEQNEIDEAHRNLTEVRETDPKTVEEGAEKYKPDIKANEAGSRKIKIVLNGDKISVYSDETLLADNIKLNSNIKTGGVALQSKASAYNIKDNVYDAVFEDIVISQLPHNNEKEGYVLFENRLNKAEKALYYADMLANRVIDFFIAVF